jgi:hypothetical protein
MRIIRAGHRFVKMVMREERRYSKEFLHASKSPIFIGDFHHHSEYQRSVLYQLCADLMLARCTTATYDCHVDFNVCMHGWFLNLFCAGLG